MTSHYRVATVNFDIERVLDMRLSARTLRQELEERAWDRLRDDIHDDGLETELEVDGQHVLLHFLRGR